MNTTDAILDRLNSYRGDDVWNDVIRGTDLDEAATDAADPTGASDVFVLTDGRTFRWVAQDGEWICETD